MQTYKELITIFYIIALGPLSLANIVKEEKLRVASKFQIRWQFCSAINKVNTSQHTNQAVMGHVHMITTLELYWVH